MLLVAGAEANQVPLFKIADAKLYVPVLIFSTQDKLKLLKQLNKWNNVLKEQLTRININPK